MNRHEKGSLLNAFLIEIGIIALFVTVILVILNFFNVVPLSSTFSFLTFLPRQNTVLQRNNTGQQNVINNQQNNGNAPLALKKVVVPESPVELQGAGGGKQPTYKFIEKSYLKINPGSLTKFDFELAVSGGTNESASGIIIGDDLSKDDAKSLFIFYYPKDKFWTIRYRHGELEKYQQLIKDEDSNVSLKAGVNISKDGKSIFINMPDGSTKAVYLSESVFETTNQIFATLQAGPTANVTLKSLIYYPVNQKN